MDNDLAGQFDDAIELTAAGRKAKAAHARSVAKSPARATPSVNAADMDAFQTAFDPSVDAVSMRFPASRIVASQPTESLGLTDAQAREGLANGYNELTPPATKSLWVLLGEQFLDAFLLLLLGAGVLSCIAYGIDPSQYLNIVLGGVLFAIVLLTGLMTFNDARKTRQTMDAFRKMVAHTCTVIRDGVRKSIPARELVVGDVVLLETGDKVPADMRLLYASSLKVENGSLTGESEPIELDAKYMPKHDIKIEECKNLAFNSSLILEGDGIGCVIATGDRTLIGRIASLTTTVTERPSTMKIEVDYFVKFISILAIAMACILFLIAVGRRQGEGVLGLFINGFIVLIVANVPQGLPATITSLQLIVAERLATQNIFLPSFVLFSVFVKRLDAVETLGATTVIASDKTGTLTMGKMTVVDAWTNMSLGTQVISDCLFQSPQRQSLFAMLRASGGAADSVGSFDNAMPSVFALQIIACVCNKAVGSRPQAAPESSGSSRTSVGVDLSGLLRSSFGRKSFENSNNDAPAPIATPGDAQLETVPTPSNSNPPSGRDALKRSTHHAPTTFSGNPSEVALCNFFEAFRDGNVESVRQQYPAVFSINFNSRNKYAVSVVRGSLNNVTANSRRYTMLMKGAPEVVTRRCNRHLIDGRIEAVTADFVAKQTEAYMYFAKRGMRVLGFALVEFDGPEDPLEFGAENNTVPLEHLIFIGMIAIQDPPRDDVPAAIAKCKTAGVKVFMVTGDHPITAAAIAGQIGLLPEGVPVIDFSAGSAEPDSDVNDGLSLVIHGAQIDNFSDTDWNYVLSHTNLVFARTTPQHKLIICQHLQERGEIVCVTGDGVNDAPALKRADIGVAMGMNGSEVAREAADVILTDDNFASIVLGVEQGRVLYDNLKKTITYTLTHLPPEILPIVLTLLFGFPAFLSSLQILSIDLLTELAPAISLAYEEKEADIMLQPPRNVKTDRLVSTPVLLYSYLIAGLCISAVATFLAACSVYWFYGIELSQLFLSDGQYFVAGDPFNLVPKFGYLCTGGGVCYSPNQQRDISFQATGAYYIVLVSGQWCHIWMCKTRRMSVFSHGLLRNHTMLMAVCVEFAIMMLVVAVPGLNNIVMGTLLPVGYGVLPLVYTAGALWLYNELRKLYVRRKGLNTLFARLTAW